MSSPMAAVAGAISQQAVRAMVDEGCKHCLVDNGGDIAMRTNRTVTVGLYAGECTPNYLAIEVPATKKMLGICTSSGTVGPSISFGKADLVTVISEDVALADACATKLGQPHHGRRYDAHRPLDTRSTIDQGGQGRTGHDQWEAGNGR
ncbi:MAG: UPF0280 family protein [Sphingobacterium sp.]|nr:UPF0280 family protein [Sphingobacterium sp.]